MRRNSITQTELARLAGVSVTTVSDALSGRTRVKTETRRRIQRMATELGYRRHALASRLRRQQSHFIGVLASDIATNPCSTEVYEAFESAAYAAGKTVLLYAVSGREDVAQRIDMLLELRANAVVAFGGFHEPELLDTVRKMGATAVEYAYATRNEGVDSVVVDYLPGAHASLLHLKELGHTSIGLIIGYPEIPEPGKCFRLTYLNLLPAYGMNCSHAEGADWSARGGEEAMYRILSSSVRPTAVITCNDLMAMGALRASLREGLRVPQDLSLVGMDDIFYSSATFPALTTLALPKKEMGRELLRLTLQEQPQAGKVIGFPQKLIIRESTGPAPGK